MNELRGNSRSGMTLIEVVMAAAIFSILMVAATLNVHRDSQALRSLARKSSIEAKADTMLDMIEKELEFAQGASPQAFLTEDLSSGEAIGFTADTNLGFPDQGTVLLQPGTASEERIGYTGLTGGPGFATLTRGAWCSNPSSHDNGTLLRWAGTAEAIEDQVNPPAAFFDGISQEMFGQVFYRGDGTGFSYRVPTDPTGGMNFFDATGEVQWGATVAGVDTLTGWSCFEFEPVAVIAEATRGIDLNGDNDQVDTFDLGRLRLRAWDTANPGAAVTDLALCPPMILQEQCAWGSDLDNDGFQDPMFLWDPATGRLRIRLFILTSTQIETPEVRLVQSALFLRNGSQN